MEFSPGLKFEVCSANRLLREKFVVWPDIRRDNHPLPAYQFLLNESSIIWHHTLGGGQRNQEIFQWYYRNVNRAIMYMHIPRLSWLCPVWGVTLGIRIPVPVLAGACTSGGDSQPAKISVFSLIALRTTIITYRWPGLSSGSSWPSIAASYDTVSETHQKSKLSISGQCSDLQILMKN